MAWLTANWFWVLIGIAFVAMHLFGHGGHGGHGGGPRQTSKDDNDIDASPRRGAAGGSSGHQH